MIFHRVYYMLELEIVIFFFKSLTAVLVCHLKIFYLFHGVMFLVAFLNCRLSKNLRVIKYFENTAILSEDLKII